LPQLTSLNVSHNKITYIQLNVRSVPGIFKLKNNRLSLKTKKQLNTCQSSFYKKTPPVEIS